MTIASNEATVAGPYNGNGVTTVFDFEFTVFAATELQVILRDALGVETNQVLTTNYSVSPTGGAYPAAGGTITMVTPPATGQELIILPNITQSQDRPFSSQSSITLNEIENALDKLTALARQLYERSLRAVTVSAFDPGDVDTLLANVNALVALETEIGVLSANIAEIQAVAGDIANVNAVAAAIANVNTVAADIADVSTVAADIADVSAVADDIASVAAVAAQLVAIISVNANLADVATVAGDTAAVNAVANNIADVNTVAAALASIIAANPSLYKTQNKVINGNFSVWQRGTAFAFSPGLAYTADRWRVSVSGGSVIAARDPFTVGTKLGQNNPVYFMDVDPASMSGASAFCLLEQRIEDVRSYAGETITVLFWAKRDSAGPIAVEIGQNFGSGGSSSVYATPTTANKLTLTTDWAEYAVTFTVPSITGKTLGTDHYLALRFFQSAGSDFNARTDTLGHHAAASQYWGVHILRGTHPASMALNYVEKPAQEEELDCFRYYLIIGGNLNGAGAVKDASGSDSGWFNAGGLFPVPMRVTPTPSRVGAIFTGTGTALGGYLIDNLGYTERAETTGATKYRVYSGTVIFDAEL